MARIHLVLDDTEKARYLRQADREGKSLSAWLREAAEEKLTAAASRSRIGSVEELGRFFLACDDRETRPEPDWEEHQKVMGRSRTEGLEVT